MNIVEWSKSEADSDAPASRSTRRAASHLADSTRRAWNGIDRCVENATHLLRHTKVTAAKLGLRCVLDFRSFRTPHSSIMLGEDARPGTRTGTTTWRTPTLLLPI